MKITDKINMEWEGLVKNGPITIVAFGDSVTHGAVAYQEFDYESVYWNRLKKKITEVRNYVPVNAINAGIGGVTAKMSVERMDSQVIAHNPDLIIICFGLNDVNFPFDEYMESLEIMFDKGKKCGADVIFMTPNMLNTYVDEDTAPVHIEIARGTAQKQNDGTMDLYMESAVALAEKMGITVCDCYSKWKELSKTENTTKLLANRINHPIREMHELFAQSLFDTIFKDFDGAKNGGDGTMFTDVK